MVRDLQPDRRPAGHGGLTLRTTGADFHQLVSTTILDPKSYFVFGRNRDAVANGGATVDYAYGPAITLNDVSDAIYLDMGPTRIDRVAYDVATWPLEAGIAMSLSEDALADDLNDLPENWCQPLAIYGTVGLRGTPTGPNPICVP